jgi:hypothetical protein
METELLIKMSMAHQVIRRTFRRVAKNGLVRCDEREWKVLDGNGDPVTGPVVMFINRAHPYAEFPGDSFTRFQVTELGYRESARE